MESSKDGGKDEGPSLLSVSKNPCSTLIGPLIEVQLCISEFIDLALGY